MAYTRHNWTCGEDITDTLLNNLEEGVEEALECCGDKGYSCTETETVLTEESVTTAVSQGASSASGQLSYSQFIDADAIKVMFGGVEYVCNKTWDAQISLNNYGASWDDSIGGYDWSEYPFSITSSESGNNYLDTEAAGTYSVKIVGNTISAETTDCFKEAVRAVMEQRKLIVDFTNDGMQYHANHSFPEIKRAYEKGFVIEGRAQVYATDSIYPLTEIFLDDNGSATFSGFSISGQNVVFVSYVIDQYDRVTRTTVTK